MRVEQGCDALNHDRMVSLSNHGPRASYLPTRENPVQPNGWLDFLEGDAGDDHLAGFDVGGLEPHGDDAKGFSMSGFIYGLDECDPELVYCKPGAKKDGFPPARE